jgi:hypothetical protein
MSDFEAISAKADKNEIERIKLIIDRLKEKNPTLVVTPLRFGKIGDNIIVTFKVDSFNHKALVEKLVVNNVKLLSNDQKTQKIIDTAKANLTNNALKNSKGWDDVKDKNLGGDQKRLSDFINEGNYNEVIRISRTISLGREAVETAKNNIDNAIERCINFAFSEGMNKKFDVEKNIQKLVQVASDNNLKLMNKIDYMKQAGFNAIAVCANNKSCVGELIGICNNSALHNLINIKAAVKLAEIILVDPESYKEDVTIAVKTLNTRWLQIALNVVMKDLEEREIILFNKLIDFINERR